MKYMGEKTANICEIVGVKKKPEKISKIKLKSKQVEPRYTNSCCFAENLFPIMNTKEKKRNEHKTADLEKKLEKILKTKEKKKLEKFSKIKQKVRQIKSRYRRPEADPVRNTFAINSLGAMIVISTIIYIYVAGILSLFFSEANFYFMREMMRILECISISIVSYFFGGIFSKTEKFADETE